MKKSITFSIIFILFAVSTVKTQTFIPVPSTGYTLDGVAENTTAISTTGGAMDASNFNLYSQYYGTLYSPVGVGLPNNGTIVSGLRTYQLQSYTGPNVLFVQPNQKDSVIFVTPQPFPVLSLLSFATQGSAIINVKVRFTDNTVQLFNGLNLDDWFTANPSVYNGFDRVLRTTGIPAYVASAGNPRMFGTDLNILCANQGKLIKNVSVQNTSTSAFVCVMAVAGSVPGYSVNGNPSICSSGTATLNATGFATYSWQPAGAFGGSNSATINVSPTSNTTYTLLGTDVSGCPGYTTITVNVNTTPPVLSLTGSSQSVCLGAAATLTASGAVNYTWTSSITNGVPFYPSVTTVYTVTGQNGCGTATAVRTVVVGPIPVSLTSNTTVVCTNKTATLSAAAVATSYTWQPVNTVTSNNNLVVNPQVNTIYTVTASDGTCVGTSTLSLLTNTAPVVALTTSSTSICPGNSVTLSATGGNNYTWTPAGPSTGTIIVSPALTTTYVVTGDNSAGCQSSSSQIISVGFQPNVFVAATSTIICPGGSATLTASGTNSYSWTSGPASSIQVVSPAQPSTIYTVTGTSALSGCTDTKTISVTVFTPTLSITGNTAICAGSAASLTASGGNNYNWSPGGMPFAGVSVTPAVNTIYTVNGTGTSGFVNCPASATIQVIINPLPTLTTTITKPVICAKEITNLTASGALTYTWVSMTKTVTAASTTVTGNSAAVVIYTVTGTNALGCDASASLTVTIKACTGLEQQDVNSNRLKVYPNPNNGEFTIGSEADLTLDLVNQLGQVVKHIQLNERNDHKCIVSDLSEGIYFVTGTHVNVKIVVGK